MKTLLSFLLIFVFVFNLFGSPLVFKVTKELSSNTEFVELGTIETSKYKQVRVRINYKAKNSNSVRAFEIYGVEGQDEFQLANESRLAENPDNNYVFDTPPSKIRIKAKGEATYTVYVWATQ